MTAITEAERLRAMLREKKSGKKAKPTPLRFAYFLDPELASQIEVLGQAFARIEEFVDNKREALLAADEAGQRDLRASGDDLTPEAAKLESAEAEMERIKADLEAAVERANTDRFFIEFRPCGDKRYTQLLSLHPHADDDAGAMAEFQNALLEECFHRFTDGDGNDLPLYDSWSEFIMDAEPEFGEMDAWRTAVMVACRRNPHRLLPH